MDKPWRTPGWKPECKQDVVDLLMQVQTGHVSCRAASDYLFPQWSLEATLARLKAIPDEKIDTSDIPEVIDFSNYRFRKPK